MGRNLSLTSDLVGKREERESAGMLTIALQCTLQTATATLHGRKKELVVILFLFHEALQLLVPGRTATLCSGGGDLLQRFGAAKRCRKSPAELKFQLGHCVSASIPLSPANTFRFLALNLIAYRQKRLVAFVAGALQKISCGARVSFQAGDVSAEAFYYFFLQLSLLCIHYLQRVSQSDE